MKIKHKKLLLGITASAITAIVPIATVVSCGASSNITKIAKPAKVEGINDWWFRCR